VAAGAREIITAEKPKFVVMMIGNNDRQTIREKAPPPAPANAQPTQPPPAVPPPPDLERQPVQQEHPRPTSAQPRQADYGPWEFQSEKWELAYVKRIDATIAALKSAGVPVIWVGLPSQRGTNATEYSSYLNELYRSRAEKAGIIYVDIWDGFVDEEGKFSPQGPDYLGQIRRLRTNDGVYFTKFGARKVALYVEREIERSLSSQRAPVALPVPAEPEHRGTKGKPGGSVRPVAGPVVPLTGANVGLEQVLLGGPRESRGASDGLSAGAVAATTGRADDFRWPRGDIMTEGTASPSNAAAPVNAITTAVTAPTSTAATELPPQPVASSKKSQKKTRSQNRRDRGWYDAYAWRQHAGYGREYRAPRRTGPSW
jgi:uncharacterized protein